jgi:hypothetical protein
MSGFVKEEPIAPKRIGCLCCGSADSLFAMGDIIAVGFGWASLTRDGECVWSEGDTVEYMTGTEAERLAALDPEHDWRIELHGPLRGRVYQRHDPGRWVLIDEDRGFA